MTKLKYKATSITIMAQSYNVSMYTFKKWLIPIQNTLGAYEGGAYKPAQVAMMVEFFGEPEYMHLISTYEKS